MAKNEFKLKMVFNPLYPIYDLSMAISGTVMIIAALVVIHKIYRNSKNIFAYVLMCFAAMLGTAYVGYTISFAFRRSVPKPDGSTSYQVNVYVNQTFSYLQLVSALQGWIFGMRYLQSANVSSLTKQWFKADTIIKTGIAVGLLYLAM